MKKGIDSEFKEKSLMQVCFFIFVLSVGIFISMGSGIFITIDLVNDGVRPCFDEGCFKKLLDYYAFSVKSAAAMMAVAGLVALVFRSDQTARQMDQTNRIWRHEQEKTAFSQYFEHKEIFNSLLTEIEKKHSFKFRDKFELYEKWFPGSKVDEFNIFLSDEDYRPLSAVKMLNELWNSAENIAAEGHVTERKMNSQVGKLIMCEAALSIDGSTLPEDFYGDFPKFFNLLRDVSNRIVSVSKNKQYVTGGSNQLFSFYKEINSKFREYKQDNSTHKGHHLICYFTPGKAITDADENGFETSGVTFADAANAYVREVESKNNESELAGV